MFSYYLMDKLASAAEDRAEQRRKSAEELNRRMEKDPYMSRLNKAYRNKDKADEEASDAQSDYYAAPSDASYKAAVKASKNSTNQRKAMMNNSVSMGELQRNTAVGAGLGGLAGAGLGYWLGGGKGALVGGLGGAGLGGYAGYNFNNMRAGLGGSNLMYPTYEYWT